MSQVVLTDIEGTTSAIDFVHRVLFPYARAEIPDFVRSHAGDPAVAAEIAAVRAGIGADASLDAVVDTLLRWIDEDRKETPLKALQGMVWARGYAEGAFTAHLYLDAWDALAAWRARGVPLYVYSSGSIAAQQLFFRHSVFGDLSAWFRGHFDTTIGGKREAAAYTRIAGQIGRPPGDILFLSDVEAELDAAREAGMATAQLVRPDTRPASSGRHPVHSSFRTIGPT